MSDIKKVYIVTEGEYSDYHICAVFATRAEAETYCAVHTKDEFDTYMVNDYEVGSIDPVQVRYVYEVKPLFYHSEKLIATLRYATGDAVETCRFYPGRCGKNCNIIDCDSHPGRTVVLTKKSERAAIKIVQDRIAKAKAEREGL